MLDVVNRRHRMAQMAGRASVEFYAGLALKAKNERGGNADVLEDAFVIRTFKNGLGVFVSKYGIVCSHSLCKRLTCFTRLGIEGLVLFKRDMQFDVENYTITVNDVTIAVFDKVMVRVEIEKDKNTQRGKVKMTLMYPIDSRNM